MNIKTHKLNNLLYAIVFFVFVKNSHALSLIHKPPQKISLGYNLNLVNQNQIRLSYMGYDTYNGFLNIDSNYVSLAVMENNNKNTILSLNPVISIVSIAIALGSLEGKTDPSTLNYIIYGVALIPQVILNTKIHLSPLYKSFDGFNLFLGEYTDYFLYEGIYTETVFGAEYIYKNVKVSYEYKIPWTKNTINSSPFPFISVGYIFQQSKLK